SPVVSSLWFRLWMRSHANRQQRKEDREETDGIQCKASACPAEVDEPTGKGWPDEPGRVECGGIQCDRVAQIVFAIHKIVKKCLTSGEIERIDNAETDVEGEIKPNVGDSAERQRRQGKRLQHREKLCDEEQSSLVDPLRDNSCQRRKHTCRKL